MEWSIQPILAWMRLIGIPLYNLRRGNRLNKLWLIQTGISVPVFLLVNLVSCLIILKETIQVIVWANTNVLERQKSSTITWMWNYAIGRFNHVITNFGTHFALLTFTSIKWPALIASFNKLDGKHTSKFFGIGDYKNFRLIFWRGLTLIILVGTNL